MSPRAEDLDGGSRGRVLRIVRLECRLELSEAAELLGLTVPQLQELEAGGVVKVKTRAEWMGALQALWKARRCSLSGCPDKVEARDLCAGHRKQKIRDGKLQPKRAYRGEGERDGA